MTFKIF